MNPYLTQRRCRRDGLTLMEILLVLALLVAISAISLPALRGPMENQRLRASGDIVRVQWSHARVKAMESGRTYVFRHQAETGRYKIEPWYMEDDYLESSDVNRGMAAGGSGGNVRQANDALSSGGLVNPTSTTATSTTELGELPESVLFVGSESELDDRSAYLSMTSSGADVDVLWSDPIFFYPDGTSSTARILIRNSRGRYLVVSVRGLTGVVRVSDMLTVEEIQQMATRLKTRGARRRAGLSLLEVMLALAILGGAIAVVGELMRFGMRNAEAARDLSTAQVFCETKVNEIASGLLPPQTIANTPIEEIANVDAAGLWLYSVDVQQLDQQGLVSVTVTVFQDPNLKLRPVEFSLVRWMIDPAQIEIDAATETGGASG